MDSSAILTLSAQFPCATSMESKDCLLDASSWGLSCPVPYKKRHPILIQRIEIRWRMAGQKFPSDVQWLAIIDTSGGSTTSHWCASEAGMHNHQSPSEDGTSMPGWIGPGSAIIKGQAFLPTLPCILLASHRYSNLGFQKDPRASPGTSVRALHNPKV